MSGTVRRSTTTSEVRTSAWSTALSRRGVLGVAAGGFRPKPGEDGVYQLVLRGATVQTISFSDRPHRIVGSVSTRRPRQPGLLRRQPAQRRHRRPDRGRGEDVIVVELLNPVWDAASRTLTYDAIVLDEYTRDGFGELTQQAEP